ncbi:MAG: DUF4198 domain-containing protein [Gammaproteobacteria bacterium]|nr:DUF4198 domain-containing protein [Gammaproteobacteria bacterium]
MRLGKDAEDTQDKTQNNTHDISIQAGDVSLADFRNRRRLSRHFVWSLSVLSLTVSGHEFWLDPSAHQVTTSQSIGLQFRVGQEFRGSAQPYLQRDINTFMHLWPSGEAPITGVLGDSRPAVKLTIKPGLNLITHLTTPQPISFRPEDAIWANYLVLDGLEAQVAAHPDVPQVPPVSERYIRSAKTLVLGPGTSSSARDRDTFLPFELILETPPVRLFPGPHRFQITTDGQPTPGILVKAFRYSDRKTVDQRVSATDGWVSLDLPSADRYLISGVRIDPDTDGLADWLSYWASLTLEVWPATP